MSTCVSSVMTRWWIARAFVMSASSTAAGRVEETACWLVDVHAAIATAESRERAERGEIMYESVSGGCLIGRAVFTTTRSYFVGGAGGVSLWATATHRPPRFCHTLIASTVGGPFLPLHVSSPLTLYVRTRRSLPTGVASEFSMVNLPAVHPLSISALLARSQRTAPLG